MAQINDHYLKLQAGYLFPEIGRRVNSFCEANPDADVIKMGIGDVKQPLAPAIVKAMHEAVDEMANKETFRGYGPEQGTRFCAIQSRRTIFKIEASISARTRFLSRMGRSAIPETCWIFSATTT